MDETGPQPDAESGPARAGPHWHALPAPLAATRLGVDSEAGLSREEAARRLAEHGPNAFEDARRARWPGMLARQFADMLIMILLVAAGLSAALGDWVDAIAILAIVGLNGALGFVQEFRAERALLALKRMLAPQSRVVRDVETRRIASAELVPGDLVRLQPGDNVPADLRLIEARDLAIDESALTGESHAVEKSARSAPEDAPIAERSSMAYAGGLIVRGRARAVVVATAYETQFGRIARLAGQIDRDVTPLQRRLGRFGARLGVIAAALAASLALSGVLLGQAWMDMFLTGVSLAVAMVPEGLPAVVTLTLALGVRAMARRNALVRRLPAAETLGAATVICSDKTGTLTRGEMSAVRLWTADAEAELSGSGYAPSGEFRIGGRVVDPDNQPGLMALLQAAALCTHARLIERDGLWRVDGEPTEGALLAAAMKAGLQRGPRSDVLRELPFSSERKRMSLLARTPQGEIAFMKGAPEPVLERCTHILEQGEARPIGDEERTALEVSFDAMAADGLRVLAAARKPVSSSEEDIDSGFTLLGFFGLMDPPRAEAPAAVAQAHAAGVRVVMITGDAPQTALAVARRIGLQAERAVTGPQLDAMDEPALLAAVRAGAVFSRVAPEHKLRLVEALQEDGEIVAMTGDGVNDAPALKRADIGVAMGVRGTDAAKSAAEMVLMDDDFATIVGAVEEGRRQYANIRKFVRYLLSSNVAEFIAIAAALLMGWPLLLLPIQILWMNLVTDGPTALALGVEKADRNVMRQPPIDPKSRVVDGRGLALILALGGYMAIAALFLFRDALHRGGEGGEALVYAQTLVFSALIVFEKVNVLNFRALDRPLPAIGVFSNPWLLGAIAASLGLQILAVYAPPLQAALHTVPLALEDWGRIAILAAPVLVIPEAAKAVRFGLRRWRQARLRAAQLRGRA